MIDHQLLTVLRGELAQHRVYVPGEDHDEARWKVTVSILEALLLKVEELANASGDPAGSPLAPEPAPAL